MNQLSNQPPLTAISRVRRVIRGLPVDRLPAQPMSMIIFAATVTARPRIIS